jgi:GntR family transcriptional regulator
MARFAVSRVTVRLALDDLRRRGAIEAQRGKGYFVSRLTAVHDLQRLQSFGEMMAPLGVETRSELVAFTEQPASGEVAAALRIAAPAPVTRIERLRIAGGTTISYDVSFFPTDIGQRLAALDLEREDIFLMLERRLGIELGFADLTIEVVPASDRQGRLLAVRAGEPVMRIRRLTHDSTGRGIDYERLYAPLDALQFRARLGRW